MDTGFSIIELSHNSTSENTLYPLLQKLDQFYIPPISSKINLEQYSKKLLKNSKVFSVVNNKGEHIGLLAIYVNDVKNQVAYISSLGLLPEYHGSGLSSALINMAFEVAIGNGMRSISLEVDVNNQKAISFYKKHGFNDTNVVKENTLFMIKELNSVGSTKPLVSISCVTYNHEKYVRDAIESFLMQKFTFPVEILIHDDASTDRTAEIIREYEKKHPDLIFPIFQSENQYSKGVKISFTYQYPRARGKYIALCEGDDYWTDPLKLQKQVDFLEENPEYVMCAHNTLRVFEDGNQEPRLAILHPKEDLELIDFIDLDYLQKRNNLVLPAHTSSYVIRASAMPKVYPEWAINCISGDLSVTTLVSSQGKTRFLNEVMSVRRKHLGSITKRSGASLMAAYMNFVVTMKAIDAYFDHKFTKIQDKNIYELLIKVVEWHLSKNDLRSAIKTVSEGYTNRSKIRLLIQLIKLFAKNIARFLLIHMTGFAKLTLKPLRWFKSYIKKN